LSEGRRWLREALNATAGLGEEIAKPRGKALVSAAMLAIEQAAYDEAEDLCEQAIKIAQHPGRGRDRVAALNTRGSLARARGHYANAVQDYSEARAVAVALNDSVGAAAALHGLATTLGFTGDARSGSLLEQSIDAFRELGDARGLAEALLSAMWRAVNAADFTRVEAFAEEALALFRTLGDTGRMAETLFVLGVTAQFQGHFERATALHQEGLRLRQGRGDIRSTVEQLSAMASIALQQGNLSRARALLEESLTILQQYDDPWNRALSLVILAQVDLADGDPRSAYTLLVESSTIYREIGNLLYVPWCLEGLAGVAAAERAWERAAQFYGAREALCGRTESPLPPCYPEGYARTFESTRAALGETGFAAAFSEGESLPTEAVLAMAASF
jgi:tetratricopeptide (TPR) repeat protein